MKKLIPVLAAAAIFTYTGCNHESVNIVNPDTEEVSVNSESKIAIAVQSSRSTRAAVTVDEYNITEAIFEMRYPNGNIIANFWNSGTGDTLQFPIQEKGDYELVINEYDENGTAYTSRHMLIIESNKNYSIKVNLGMNIEVLVNPGDTTSHLFSESLITSGIWNSLYEEGSNSYVDFAIEDSMVHAELFLDNSQEENYADLLCYTELDFSEYGALAINCSSSDSIIVSLLDVNNNFFEVILPPSDSLKRHTIQYDQFTPAHWVPQGTVFDPENTNTVVFSTNIYSNYIDTVSLNIKDLRLVD